MFLINLVVLIPCITEKDGNTKWSQMSRVLLRLMNAMAFTYGKKCPTKTTRAHTHIHDCHTPSPPNKYLHQFAARKKKQRFA